VSIAAEEHQQRSELRQAFLRHLPKRVSRLVKRGRGLCAHGFDINGMSLLYEDVQRMAGAAGRYGAVEVCGQLLAMEGLLGSCLGREAAPDASEQTQLLEVFELVLMHTGPDTPAPMARAAARPGNLRATPDEREPFLGRAETPPSHYWLRWQETSPPAATPPPTPVASNAPLQAPTKPTASPIPAVRNQARIYHLSDGSALAVELDQCLEVLGHEIEILEDGDELREVLTALAPDLIIVDAGFCDQLESIATVLRCTRERTGARHLLLAIADADTMPVRLTARRAGVDALLVQPRTVVDVVAKVDELLDGAEEASYRVMIVEDDRAQAIFAESILRKAGMKTRVVDNAFDVIAAMEDFGPDLVLMDLYMPGCDGTELTALIREREEFLHTPIVFLSGESDLDKHYEALDAGGDDFLSKPVRPKHLISAVRNRVSRSRTMLKRASRRDPRDPVTGLHSPGLALDPRDPRDPVTGLYARSHALDRINAMLADDDASARSGGLLFLDFDGTAAMREKFGLSGTEQVLAEASTLIAQQLGSDEIASRYGDGTFLVLCPERTDTGLLAFAVSLRNLLGTHGFSVNGRPLRLRLAIGICEFRLGFADAAELLNAAERASRDARALDRGVVLFEPTRRASDAEEAALTGMIREAIERDSFELLYQPIVAVQGGDESLYQTLLRLRGDDGRLHSAAALIPVAERADLMLDVDRWVLAQSLRTIDQRRLQDAPVRLFVNQTASSLRSPGHAEWLLSQMQARSIAGTQLVIEMALDEMILDLTAIAVFCRELVPHGVQICISRYEMGDSATAALEMIPASFIKLGVKYIIATQAQPMRDELRTLIDQTHRRGLQVIAQRVEDAQSAATLWMSGIDFIQGNLVQHAARELSFDFKSAVL
jgi:diguanylate cyclase (GGDEF)-like protein